MTICRKLCCTRLIVNRWVHTVNFIRQTNSVCQPLSQVTTKNKNPNARAPQLAKTTPQANASLVIALAPALLLLLLVVLHQDDEHTHSNCNKVNKQVQGLCAGCMREVGSRSTSKRRPTQQGKGGRTSTACLATDDAQRTSTRL